MGFIPHPEIPVGELRTTDMIALLVAGALWELVGRLLLWSFQKKPASLEDKERRLLALQLETNKKRKLGPSAFVETSKLERMVLAEEKDLEEIYESRRQTISSTKRALRIVNYVVTGLVFVLFYGVAVIGLDGSRLASTQRIVISEEEADRIVSTWTTAFMFPISYVGAGIRLSRWGMEKPRASVGGLIVFWSAQVTVGKILDGVEALMQLPQS